MKTALLVCFSPMTRIIVDIPDDQTVEEFLEKDQNYADVCKAAREKMAEGLDGYLCPDNCESVNEDIECPYGVLESDQSQETVPMTKEEFDKKWKNVNPDNLTDEQLEKLKNDCFALYENTGFLETFDSPYDEYGEHNGMKFQVIRRATRSECDLVAMPLWLVRFENGDEAYCYPEEIAKIAHENKEPQQGGSTKEAIGSLINDVEDAFKKDDIKSAPRKVLQKMLLHVHDELNRIKDACEQ